MRVVRSLITKTVTTWCCRTIPSLPLISKERERKGEEGDDKQQQQQQQQEEEGNEDIIISDLQIQYLYFGCW